MKDPVTQLAEKILIAMYHGAACTGTILSEKTAARKAWNAAKELYHERENTPYELKKPEAF